MNGFNEKVEKRFMLYMESPNSLYLPRFYAQDKLGLSTKVKMNSGDNVDIRSMDH